MDYFEKLMDSGIGTDRTLNYYSRNASLFSDDTQTVDFHEVQELFCTYLKPSSHILDFGCGAGRDTKFFLQKGYQVTAIDGSEEICAAASAYTGISVRKLLFQELEDIALYDAVWACASILHVPRKEQPDIFRRMIRALKAEGLIYTSFKYGSFEGFRGERYYTDFDEDSFTDFIKAFPELSIKKMWVTGDVRPGRSNEKWLNIILRKPITG